MNSFEMGMSMPFKVQRHLRVAKVCVRHAVVPSAHLEESVQKFPDGGERIRNLLLSEKIIGDEEPLVACMRGIVEEIGEAINCDPKEDAVTIDEASLNSWVEVSESPSFPGLETVYTLYQVNAIVSELPTSSFWTSEMHPDGSIRVTHVFEWHPTVNCHDSLSLNNDQMKLIQRLYRGSRSVNVKQLHGGFSGSLVLMANANDMDGHSIDPTIIKLDTSANLRDEVHRTNEILDHIGSNATKIMRPAEYEKDYGGVVVEMAGACWVLPQFYVDSMDSFELIRSMRTVLLGEFRMDDDTAPLRMTTSGRVHVEALVAVSRHVIAELWGAGGSLYMLAQQTAQRDGRGSIQYVFGILQKIAEKMSVALLPCYPNMDAAEPPYSSDLRGEVGRRSLAPSSRKWICYEFSHNIEYRVQKQTLHSL